MPDVDGRPGDGQARWPLFAGLAVAVVALDQLTKAWVVANVAEGGSTELLGPYLRLIMTHNTGGLFGLFQGNAVVFAAVSLAVMGLIVAYESQAGGGLLASLALGLLLGGAVGNFIDRIRLGYVVDFVDMGVGDLRWYTYNVADAAISTAIVLLVLLALLPGLASALGGRPKADGDEARLP